MPYPEASGGNPVEHADAEATSVRTTRTGRQYSDGLIANGATIMSAQITITKKSLVVVFATWFGSYSVKASDIKRGGITKTKETTISQIDYYTNFLHMQYATELLEAGTYQYDLVNTYGSDAYFGTAGMKIVAVAVE